MEKNEKKVAGRDLRGHGKLLKFYRVLRAARDAFFFAPMASQTARGTVLGSYQRYGV